jgi:hypothetical protein
MNGKEAMGHYLLGITGIEFVLVFNDMINWWNEKTTNYEDIKVLPKAHL